MGCVFLIVAAGASARMGQPKALLEVAGEPLVCRMARLVEQAGARPLIVLGAHAEQIAARLGDLSYVLNPAWQAGLGGSIACGASAVRGADKIGVVAVDQPGLTADELARLIAACEPPFEASACVHEGGELGVPAVFGPSMFEALRGLEGGCGARGLLRQQGRRVARVEGVCGADVDTPQAWQAFLEASDAHG